MKVSIGKLKLDARFEDGVRESGFGPCQSSFRHAEQVIELPGHHRDPFDRMLIAQALVEGLTIDTAQGSRARQIGRYESRYCRCDL